MTFRPSRAVCALAVVSFLAACGGGGAGTPIKLKGTFNGAGESGLLDVTLPESAKAAAAAAGIDSTPATAATAIITFSDGTASVSLSGTYDSATGNFSLTGGGYTLTGNLKNGIATGSYTGPKGMGQFAAQAVATGTVKTFCGTYMDSAENGTWNVTVGSNGAASGSFYNLTKGGGGALSGTVKNDMLDLNNGAATGTVSGDSVSGTYKAKTGTGTFTGTVAACTK